jgi:hypothetical protein
MSELQELKTQALAQGLIGDTEVEVICRALYPEGKIDGEVVEFLLSLRDEARAVGPTFKQFLVDAIKHCVLLDGPIDAEKADWLRQRLFSSGGIGEREKKLLWDLKHEATQLSEEFQKLYDEYM